MGSHQMVSQSASQSSSSFQQQQRSASSSNRQASSSNNNNGAIEACSDTTASQQQNGYGSVLQKSKSGGSLVQENTDSLLKEMDNALKASSNFIESHRSSSTAGPNSRSTTEYHEYRSYSNGGTKGGNAGGEFNLEKQVQHMIPPPSPSLSGLMERSNQQRNISSYQQQQQQTHTTYKVQSNQYSSTSNNQMLTTNDNEVNGQDNERPGSRLKQNIDELDTLLSDLNNARKDTTPSGGQDYNLSSDDYSFSENQQGHVSKQVRSLNEYNYNQTSSSTSAKPPSPSPRRRSDGRPGGPILASPSTVRKASPSPVSTSTPRRHGREASPPGGVHYSSSYHSEQQQQKTTTSSLQDYHRSSSPYNPDRGSPAPGPPPRRDLSPSDGTPTGVSYYTKYHSTHTHHSQQGNDTTGAPITFPTNGSPTKLQQNPPKRVDELMTELSEFDPSIQPTGFVEPTGPPKSHITETSYSTKTTTENDFGGARNFRDRSASPPVKPQPSTPGPAVYYPPGEIFASSKGKYDSLDNNATPKPAATPVVHASHSTSLEGARSGKGSAKAEYGYKAKGRYQEAQSDGKQGAAVVPICLPLCCAAPCVIL